MRLVNKILVGLIVTVLAGVVVFLTLPPAPVSEAQSPSDRLESPWGIPDYNNDPKYDEVDPKTTAKLIEETPETVNNYVPEYDTHYSENAKAICTSLDAGGLKADDVFGAEEPGSFGHVAVKNYCPHNL